MSGTPPINANSSRSLGMSARKRERELVVHQREQSVPSSYDEVAVDHRQSDVAGAVTNNEHQDEVPYQEPQVQPINNQASHEAGLRRGTGKGTDVHAHHNGADGDNNAHNVKSATPSTSRLPATPHPKANSLYLRRISSASRIIKDVTSSSGRERSLFYYGTDKLPVGKTTGIFSPQITLTANNGKIRSRVVLKEGHVYLPNPQESVRYKENKKSRTELDNEDWTMPFKVFGWSSSGNNASAQSKADPSSEPSQKQPVNMNSLPPGIRLTAFSARLRTLRIEDIEKRPIQQEGDPDVDVDKPLARLSLSNQDSPLQPDIEGPQPEAASKSTRDINNISTHTGEQIAPNEFASSNDSSGPSLEPLDSEILTKPQVSEADKTSKKPKATLSVRFADAYVTNVSMSEDEPPVGSSSNGPEVTDMRSSPLKTLLESPHDSLLDKHDLARAEEIAARTVLAKYTPAINYNKIGNFAFGEQPSIKLGKAKLRFLRKSLAQHVKGLDLTNLEKDHTIAAWKRDWAEYFLHSGAALIEINHKQDIEAYLHDVLEVEGDVNDEGIDEFLKLMQRGEIAIDEFVALVEEEEARSKQRRQQRSAQDGVETAIQDDVDCDATENRPWPRLPCTPGWEPVKEGWVSHDGKIKCVQAGTIPKFEYLEKQDGKPAPRLQDPKIIWTGPKDCDDEHINEEISFKILGLDDMWKATPTGMFIIDDCDDDYETDSDESDIGWSSRLLNYRLMLTCNSVNGSNVDLSYDPEELDIPTMDTNRNFKKMDCLLNVQYPNYVRTERKFNRMGEIVVIPPPVRKDKIPRKACLMRKSQLRRGRRGRPVATVDKKVTFSLKTEQKETSDKYHPRQSCWVRRKQAILRKAFRQHGLFEMLPSVKAQLTRIRGYEAYYPRFLQPPVGAPVYQTGSYGAGYMLNHISRFKLGLPTSEEGRTRGKIRSALQKILQHRKNAQTRYQQNKHSAFVYKLFTRAHQRRRIRPAHRVLEEDVRLVGGFQKRNRLDGLYMVYWKKSRKTESEKESDGDWTDVPGSRRINEGASVGTKGVNLNAGRHYAYSLGNDGMARTD
ncbi:hypothetical protein TWF481_004364 [Arthrobotrys musiformis]|uniref:Uncharacterized protein n=1 Tax=Arthrobotrys musiformis TaxID=47236 RepID=A0AAV9WKF4_9PEZI